MKVEIARVCGSSVLANKAADRNIVSERHQLIEKYTNVPAVGNEHKYHDTVAPDIGVLHVMASVVSKRRCRKDVKKVEFHRTQRTSMSCSLNAWNNQTRYIQYIYQRSLTVGENI